ncbi:TMEM175 family protein [Rhodocaloribacter sp.]
MHKGRVEAFSDGVIAILITIMVLEMKAPHGDDIRDLLPVIPVFVSYVLSFVYLGIYWSNHHHLFQAVEQVKGPVLLANLHLLFWLSLIPFTTAWMGENDFQPWPVALYGLVLLMSGVAYFILTWGLLRHHAKDSALALAIGKDWKGRISVGVYTVAVPLAFVNQWIAFGLYVLTALMWILPDRRIERVVGG